MKMLQFVTCSLLLLKIIASAECIKPRSVNIALETILAFDNKNKNADIKFIDDVQSFLSQVRNVVDTKPVRRSSNNNVNWMRFTEFVRELIELLKSYDNDDLEDIFTVIDDEIRKYHYKGCKFYELVEDPSLRRYVANKLNLIKEKPAKDIRWKLDGTLQVLEDAKFDSTQTDVLDYINSLFTRDDGAEFKRILDILQTYKSKSKRTNLDLVKLVRDSIRTVIFDKYSRLNPNTRKDFKIKLETFWKYWNQPQTYNNKVWDTLNMGKQNIRFFDNYKTTPINLNKELKDVLFSKELVTMTPFNQDSKDEPKSKIFIIKRDESKYEKDYSSKRSDNDGSDTIPESNSDDKAYNRDLPMFGNKHTYSEQSESQGIKRQTKSNQYSSNGHDSGQDESSVIDVTKKSKVHHKKTKDSTSMFINVGSEQFVGPEKISYTSDFLITHNGGKSKRNPKHQNTFSYVSLYPERISTKKRRFKVESTTRKSNTRMQTIWKERLKFKTKRHRNKQRPDSNSDSDLDEEIYVDTKMPKSQKGTKNRVKPQRPKSNTKHRHRHRHRIGKMRYTKDNTHNNVRSQYDAKYKSNAKNENYGKSEYLKPINDLITFKITSQKKTREHKLHKSHKHKKNVKSAKEKMQKQKYADKSMDERSDMYKRHKRVDPSIEEETHTKRHRPVSKPIIYKAEKLMEEKPLKVIASAHDKDKDVNESTETELESTSETQKISANVSKQVIDSLSKTEDEYMEENTEASLKTYKTIENPTELDLDYNEHEISSEVTEEEYTSVKNKRDEKSIIENYDGIGTTKHRADKDLLVNYITTTPRIEVELNEELASSRPRYKMLEESVAKESFNPNYARHRMVDNSVENKLITHNFIHPMNQTTKDSYPNIKMAERSTESEAENIISKNLYKKATWKKIKHDDPKQSKLSEEGLSIEAYESNFTQSFRKSNDLDNFTPTKRMPMRRIYLTFKPEVSKKPNTTDTKADYLLLQKNRYSTLPFWEGTTKNTRITKRNGSIPFITTTRNTVKFTYTSASTFQTTNTSSTSINNVSKKNYTAETLPYWSSAPTPSVPLTTNTTQKVTATPSTKEMSTFSQSDNVTLPKNILVTNPQMIHNEHYTQEYINRNIEMLERYRISSNKPSPGIIPFANIKSNANLSAENFRSVLHKDLTTTPPRPTKYSTISQSHLSKINKNKPNIVSSDVDVTKHADPTPVSIIDDIEHLLNRYGLSSMPPPLLNSVKNNSMARRNLALDNLDPNIDKSKQDLEINSDSEVFDNLLDKHVFSPRDEHFETEGDETNPTKELSKDVQDVKSRITKFQNFHHFLTDTTKMTFNGQKIDKMKYFDKADFHAPLKHEAPKVADIGIEDFDPALELL